MTIPNELANELFLDLRDEINRLDRELLRKKAQLQALADAARASTQKAAEAKTAAPDA